MLKMNNKKVSKLEIPISCEDVKSLTAVLKLNGEFVATIGGILSTETGSGCFCLILFVSLSTFDAMPFFMCESYELTDMLLENFLVLS